ncbi:hypothetical protein NU08_1553 [Flavobacterium anhuiense]|uniref:Uncharacterized protein n=1 Tax=Flavobacterium anhuiense TaxID=459526 RepID=A0A444W029_9FLAO|nr:hypothetical protein NU08_1553 [Flavobacterium anhuiense]
MNKSKNKKGITQKPYKKMKIVQLQFLYGLNVLNIFKKI